MLQVVRAEDRFVQRAANPRTGLVSPFVSVHDRSRKTETSDYITAGHERTAASSTRPQSATAGRWHQDSAGWSMIESGPPDDRDMNQEGHELARKEDSHPMAGTMIDEADTARRTAQNMSKTTTLQAQAATPTTPEAQSKVRPSDVTVEVTSPPGDKKEEQSQGLTSKQNMKTQPYSPISHTPRPSPPRPDMYGANGRTSPMKGSSEASSRRPRLSHDRPPFPPRRTPVLVDQDIFRDLRPNNYQTPYGDQLSDRTVPRRPIVQAPRLLPARLRPVLDKRRAVEEASMLSLPIKTSSSTSPERRTNRAKPCDPPLLLRSEQPCSSMNVGSKVSNLSPSYHYINGNKSVQEVLPSANMPRQSRSRQNQILVYEDNQSRHDMALGHPRSSSDLTTHDEYPDYNGFKPQKIYQKPTGSNQVVEGLATRPHPLHQEKLALSQPCLQHNNAKPVVLSSQKPLSAPKLSGKPDVSKSSHSVLLQSQSAQPISPQPSSSLASQSSTELRRLPVQKPLQQPIDFGPSMRATGSDASKPEMTNVTQLDGKIASSGNDIEQSALLKSNPAPLTQKETRSGILERNENQAKSSLGQEADLGGLRPQTIREKRQRPVIRLRARDRADVVKNESAGEKPALSVEKDKNRVPDELKGSVQKPNSQQLGIDLSRRKTVREKVKSFGDFVNDLGRHTEDCMQTTSWITFLQPRIHKGISLALTTWRQSPESAWTLTNKAATPVETLNALKNLMLAIVFVLVFLNLSAAIARGFLVLANIIYWMCHPLSLMYYLVKWCVTD